MYDVVNLLLPKQVFQFFKFISNVLKFPKCKEQENFY